MEYQKPSDNITVTGISSDHINRQAQTLAQKLETHKKIIEANGIKINAPFDPRYAASLIKRILEPLSKYYFRTEFVGFEGEDYPDRKNDAPLIFASNHSGMAFPWDAIIFSSMLLKLHNYDMSKVARPLTAPMLSQSNLMSPFAIENFWKKAGGVDATSLNFETMMEQGIFNVLIYPEGVGGIGKGFDKKYELQRLSTSTLRMSLKHKADIIPFATVNAEYINPFSYSIEFLDNLVQKLGIPFLPVGFMTVLIPLQPWMFYFALPAKLIFVRGRRIKPYKILGKPVEDATEEEIYALRDAIHAIMQRELNEAVEQYGESPYNWKEFFLTALWKWKKLPEYLPFTWAFRFIDHEKQFNKRLFELNNFSNIPPSLEQKVIQAQEIAQTSELEEQLEEEKDVLDVLQETVELVTENPEVLLMYVPVVGWLPTIWKEVRNRI
ncbi:glycerol acyltransferase [Bernardetia sp.]|uniref:glycerol acyltransferase n=1 Tax=Bernardetia sp. TaxID=1937974 RepID=UPI0025C4C03E|nr:glycerol acyltransferase [Bernardetia sp.]